MSGGHDFALSTFKIHFVDSNTVALVFHYGSFISVSLFICGGAFLAVVFVHARHSACILVQSDL